MTSDESKGERPRLRRVPTADLLPAEIEAIRALLWAAFPPGDDAITEADWEHALGGVHFVLELGGRVIAHAAVVERELQIGGRPLRAGYVEAVATAPSEQGRGLGTRVMEDVSAFIRDRFELGALGTGKHHFYERLGWVTWRGPSGVRAGERIEPTPDDDGYLLVLKTPSSPPLDENAPITCDFRPGDVW